MTRDVLLRAQNLSIDLFTTRTAVRPVDDVSYSLAAGETLAIVGESGSGKTVLNFAPLGLMPVGVVTNGNPWWNASTTLLLMPAP